MGDTVQIRFGKTQAADLEKQAWQFVHTWDAKAEACLVPYYKAWLLMYRNDDVEALQQAKTNHRKIFSSPEAKQAHQRVKDLLKQEARMTDLVLKKALKALESEFQAADDETAGAEENILEEQDLLLAEIDKRSPAYAERYKQLIEAENNLARSESPHHSNWLDSWLQDLNMKPEDVKRLLDAMEPVMGEWHELAELIHLKELLLTDGTRREQPFIDPSSHRPLTFAQLMQSDDDDYLAKVLNFNDRLPRAELGAPYINPGPERVYVKLSDPFIGKDRVPTRVSLRQALNRTAGQWAFPSVEKALDNPNSYLMKEKHAIKPSCTPINAPDDVCVDTYIGDDQPLTWPLDAHSARALHETVGHAGGFLSINPDLPYLLRSHNQVSTEGLAFMTELLLAPDPHWQKVVLGMDDATIQQVKPAAAKLKWQTIKDSLDEDAYRKARFVQKLYSQPNQDLDSLSKKMLGDEHEWKKDTSLMTHPSRYVIYTMAHLWMAQVAEYLENRFGGVYTEDAGRYLREHFAQGKMYDWQESAKALTGQPLSVEPLRRMIRKQYTEVVQELLKMGPSREQR